MRSAFLVPLGVCLLVVVLSAAPADGALISGSETFVSLDEGWEATVDYWVYAPGEYPGTHQDQAENYIYAYQIFAGTANDVALSTFTVGLDTDSGAANPAIDGTYGLSGGDAPDNMGFSGDPPRSVIWSWNWWEGNGLDAGEYSTALVFSSPNSWQWKSATLIDGGDGVTKKLPSPIPEPLTMTVMAAGGMLALLSRRRAALS